MDQDTPQIITYYSLPMDSRIEVWHGLYVAHLVRFPDIVGHGNTSKQARSNLAQAVLDILEEAS